MIVGTNLESSVAVIIDMQLSLIDMEFNSAFMKNLPSPYHQKLIPCPYQKSKSRVFLYNSLLLQQKSLFHFHLEICRGPSDNKSILTNNFFFQVLCINFILLYFFKVSNSIFLVIYRCKTYFHSP